MNNDNKYKNIYCGLIVSFFITLFIFLIYVFTVNVVKKIFPFLTQVINQENLIFLIFLQIFSFFQYLDMSGNIISLLFKRVPLNGSKFKLQIKFIISVIFLLSFIFLPLFISFSYLKNVYPIFEQFFLTGNPNWIVYLTILLINYFIYFIGYLILKVGDIREKIVGGIFIFPIFVLLSIFLCFPLIILYFILKILPFFNPLFINFLNGSINWISIIVIFLFYLIFYMCLSLSYPWIKHNFNLLFYLMRIFNYCFSDKK